MKDVTAAAARRRTDNGHCIALLLYRVAHVGVDYLLWGHCLANHKDNNLHLRALLRLQGGACGHGLSFVDNFVKHSAGW